MFSYTLYIKILSVLEMGKYNYCYCIVGEKCGTDYTLNLVFPFSLRFFFFKSCNAWSYLQLIY